MIIGFTNIYEKVLEPESLSMYFNVLKEIPDNQVNIIIQNCLKKCHYFPRPADIFENYDEYATESHKIEKITLTEAEKEKNLQRIRRLQEELKKVREPQKIGDIIKNYKEGNE